MATYDLRKASGTKIPANVRGVSTPVQNVVDFSTVNAGSGMAQNDVAQLIHVPAGCAVEGVHVEVDGNELSANLADFDIGDGVDPDGFGDGLDATAAVDNYVGVANTPALNEAAPNTFTGYALGKYYAAADTIDLTVKTAATILTGKVRVTAWIRQVKPGRMVA